MTLFMLGAHRPGWLDHRHPRWRPYDAEFPFGPPLFVSLSTCSTRRLWSDRQVPWALDNGAFAAIFGPLGRPPDPAETLAAWWRIADAGARPSWAVAPDRPAHPAAMAHCGYSLADAVAATVDNYLQVRGAAPFPVVPVITGDGPAGFERCMERYRDEGVELGDDGGLVAAGALVGAPRSTLHHVARLAEAGRFRLHLLGIKGRVLAELAADFGEQVFSSDSLAWSSWARTEWAVRQRRMLEECDHEGSCNACLRWAMTWAADQGRPDVDAGRQLRLL